MNRDNIIDIAVKCGGNMVYVWGATPKVDNLDIFEFSRLLIEEYIKQEQEINDEYAG